MLAAGVIGGVVLASVLMGVVVREILRPPAPEDELPRDQVDRLAERARERAEALWARTNGSRDTI